MPADDIGVSHRIVGRAATGENRQPDLIWQEICRQILEGKWSLVKTKRQQLERATLALVERATTQGRTIDVNALAIELSSNYPQSGISLDAICSSIEEDVAMFRAEKGAHHRPHRRVAPTVSRAKKAVAVG